MAAVISLRDQRKALVVAGPPQGALSTVQSSLTTLALDEGQPHSMELIEFYRAVLPDGGRYVLYQDKSQSFFPTLEALERATQLRIETQGLYFAVAAYGAAPNRTGDNVRALRSHRLDIDAGEAKFAKHGDQVYPTQREAIAAVVGAVKAGLPMPSLIVSSGDGLHIYWNLDDDATPANWKPVAMLLNAASKGLGLRVDQGVTADTARILRPVGTLHKNGSRVRVLKNTGMVYSNEDLGLLFGALAQVGGMLPRFPIPDSRNINDDVLTRPSRKDDRSRDVGLIAKECGMVGAFMSGETFAEPVWRATIGVMKYCRDGERLWHEASAKDSRYDRAEAQRKWDLYIAGPTRCGVAPQCSQCRHQGKISSPVQLGSVVNDAPLKANPDNVQALQDVVAAGGLQGVMDQDGQLNFIIAGTDAAGRGVRTVLNANSTAADDAILDMASAAGKPPSDRAIETFKAKMRHAARQRGEAVPVHLRVAQIWDVVYVDLGPGRISRIDGSNVEVVDDLAEGVPLFRRGVGVGQLPAPENFGSAGSALRFAVGVLREQLGLTAAQALLVVVVVVEWHRTGTPHPILETVGPAGSGKSTVADFLLSLVDPSGDGGRITIGTAGPDIAAAAQQRYVLPLDNAGRQDKATSDMLCIVSTGGTLMVRLLYTNGETANLKLHRPLVVTAVSPVCVAPDLQSRVVRLELPARRGDYKAESELRARWDGSRPRMLGAIYNLISGGFRELPRVRARADWAHRLVDFDQMGEAVIAAAGLPEGTFLRVVGQMREHMAQRTASGDMFLMALLAALRKLAAKPTHTQQPSLNAVLQLPSKLAVLAYGDNRIEVTARPGGLQSLLPSFAGFSRDGAIPATERGLIDAVRRVQPLLAGIGVDVQELASGSRTLLRFDFGLESIRDE